MHAYRAVLLVCLAGGIHLLSGMQARAGDPPPPAPRSTIEIEVDPTPPPVCEKWVGNPTEKVAAWMAEQQAAGRTRFVNPFGARGATGLCAY